MEYNNPQTFQRLTGRAIFTPDGQAGGIDLGNIEMVRSDYGTKTIESMTSVRGVVSRRRRDTHSSAPIFSIDGNQLVAPNLPLLLLGDQLDDFAQIAGTGSTFTFTAVAGLTFVIGAYGMMNVVVKVGAVTKVIDQDYYLDNFNGTIGIPISPIGIVPGNTVVVTFDQPGLALDQYTAFTHLDRTGTLIVFCEDDQGPPAAEIWTMSVSLSCKKGPDTDPSKFRRFTLEAAVIGFPNVKHRGDVLNLGVGVDTFIYG